MQPYFDPTRKTTSKKMEDDLEKNQMEGDLKEIEWKTNSNKKKMENDLKKMKMEDDLKKK